MLTLIQRDDCTLCDKAWEVLHLAGIQNFTPMYIDGDAVAERRYGSRVPVLRLGQNELDWPFSVSDIKALLELSEPI
jgi:hypothetical protein